MPKKNFTDNSDLKFASLLDFDLEEKSQYETNLESITELCRIVVDGAENNSYIILKRGTEPLNGECNSEIYKVGNTLSNQTGAVDDNIRYGMFPVGTLMISVKRRLSRDEGEEDPVTEGLPEEFQHKISFVRTEKTMKRYLTANEVARSISQKEMDYITNTLRKRYQHEKKCQKAKSIYYDFEEELYE